MSNRKPALEQGGLTTPAKVTQSGQQGNTPTHTKVRATHTTDPEATASLSPPYRSGHEAAFAWWMRFLDESHASKPYPFNSGLRDFAASLPPAQTPQFLDSVGTLLVSWLTIGRPTRQFYAGPARIAFYALPPAQQDAQIDDDGAPLTELSRQMDAECEFGRAAAEAWGEA